MARARSPEKRQALLAAAIREIAASGLGASTASIARAAALAEGTLFTYFPSKDLLFNELYLELKSGVYRHIHADFPLDAPLRDRAHHIWTRYLSWTLANPEGRKASVLLHLSPIISPETKAQVDALSGPIARTMQEFAQHGAFQDLPPGFAASAMSAMQDAVIEMAIQKPRQKSRLIEQAFDAFWRMAQ
jgi:AcrR family transcriptional regulator